jgi:hypothetical protein
MAGNNSVNGDQVVTFTDNLSFDGTERSGAMTTNGQLWIGATASNRANNGGHVRLGTLTSPDSSVTIGYSAPNITLSAGSAMGTVQHLTGDTGGPLNPTAGNFNLFGNTNAIIVDGSGSTLTFSLRAQVLQPTASAAAPSYAFVAHADSGLYYNPGFPGTALTSNGVPVFDSNAAGLFVNRAVSVGWDLFVSAFASAISVADPDTTVYIGISNTAAPRTVTLATSNAGRYLIVKDESGGAAANNITLTPGDGSLIDGAATAVINVNYGSLSLVRRNNNWWIV